MKKYFYSLETNMKNGDIQSNWGVADVDTSANKSMDALMHEIIEVVYEQHECYKDRSKIIFTRFVAFNEV